MPRYRIGFKVLVGIPEPSVIRREHIEFSAPNAIKARKRFKALEQQAASDFRNDHVQIVAPYNLWKLGATGKRTRRIRT